MALGSSCVTLSELTGVYATFNRLGKRAKMIYLRRVLDRDGRILEDHSSFYDPWTTLDDRVSDFQERVGLGMPETGGSEASAGFQVKIEAW